MLPVRSGQAPTRISQCPREDGRSGAAEEPGFRGPSTRRRPSPADPPADPHHDDRHAQEPSRRPDVRARNVLRRRGGGVRRADARGVFEKQRRLGEGPPRHRRGAPRRDGLFRGGRVHHEVGCRAPHHGASGVEEEERPGPHPHDGLPHLHGTGGAPTARRLSEPRSASSPDGRRPRFPRQRLDLRAGR